MGCLTMIIFAIFAFVAMNLFTISKPIGIVAFVLLIAAYIYVLKKTTKKDTEKTHEYEEKENVKDLPFNPEQQYISPDHKSGIYIDLENRQVGFLVATDANSYNLEIRRYLFDDVWDSILIEDDKTLSHISRLDDITAPIETETADTETKTYNESPIENIAASEVSVLEMKVVVTQKYDVEYKITFLDTRNAFGNPEPINKENNQYQEAITEAWKWQELMQLILTNTTKPETEKESLPDEVD